MTKETDFGIDFNSKDNPLNDKTELIQMFNSHCINIVEKMTGIPPDIIPLYDLQANDIYCVKQTVRKIENHSSTVKI